MKKTIYTVSAIMLIISILFTGCTTAKTKNGEENTTSSTVAPETENQQTENYSEYETQIEILNNPVSTESNTTVVPTTEINKKTPNQTSSAVENTTKKQVELKQENTTKYTPQPPATEGTTEPDLSNLSVKEIQDLLFETEDENIAGKILTIAGFDYDSEQGIYYSQVNPLQRLFGFNIIYDLAAPRTGMIYSTKRIFFNYDNKDWMIQIWKGQYGITAGAEIGLYNKPEDRVLAQYDCAKDSEMITMSYDFYNAGKYEFSRGPEKHWWLTGFKVLHLGIAPLIDLDITLEFPNRAMSDAFEKGLKELNLTNLVDRLTYERKGNKFYIEW